MYNYYFAQAYGCDAYGQNAYNTCATTTSGGDSNTGGNSNLADTGISVAIFTAVAVIVMFAAMAVRFWRRKKTNPAPKQSSKTDR